MRYFLLEVFILISWQKNKSIILCKLCNEMFLKTPNKEVYGITIIIIYLVNLNFPPQTSHTVTLILQNYPDIKLFKNFCYIFKIIFFFAFSLFFFLLSVIFFFSFCYSKGNDLVENKFETKYWRIFGGNTTIFFVTFRNYYSSLNFLEWKTVGIYRFLNYE